MVTKVSAYSLKMLLKEIVAGGQVSGFTTPGFKGLFIGPRNGKPL